MEPKLTQHLMEGSQTRRLRARNMHPWMDGKVVST
jgi:hypothetical protein